MTSRTTRSNRQPVAATDPGSLPTEVLRLRLQQANLVSTGRRPQLVKRLTEHLRSGGVAITRARTRAGSRSGTSPTARTQRVDNRTSPMAADEDSNPEADGSASPVVEDSSSSDEDGSIADVPDNSSDSDRASDPEPADRGGAGDDSMSDSDRLWRRRRSSPNPRSSTSSRRRHYSPARSRISSSRSSSPASRYYDYRRSSGRSRSKRYSPSSHRWRSRSYSRSPRSESRRTRRRSASPSHRDHRHSHTSRPSRRSRHGTRDRSKHYHRHVAHHDYRSRSHDRPRSSHRSHRYRSIHSRLGPTPSPTPLSTSGSDTDEEPPPSACGQPLPPSILRKIRRGEFVNLSLLLPHPPHLDPDHKNSRLSVATMEALRYHFPQPQQQQQQQRRPGHQQITNLESWLRAWSRYLYAVIHYFPRKAVQMIAYQDIIISSAERYQFEGLYSYDRAFRAKLAHDHTIRWDTVDDHLWSMWCSAQAKPLCSRCHKFGHIVTACPVATRSFRPNQPSQSPKTKDGRIICLRFNTSSCSNPAKCKFAHVCLKCEGDHAQSSTACGRA